jgi:hypothetical protein
MGTVAIIVLGVVVISVVSVIGGIVTNLAQSRTRAKGVASTVPAAEIVELNARLTTLEHRLEERDESLRKLQDEVQFMTRMLEDKSGSAQ